MGKERSRRRIKTDAAIWSKQYFSMLKEEFLNAALKYHSHLSNKLIELGE
jgi:hypothetical protein